jgi:two-component system OmpR family sensor kinase
LEDAGKRLRPPSTERLLATLEQLLSGPATDLRASLSHASDLVARATGADKVDIFIHDPKRDSLAATGSNQPLSALQRKHGLDVLPVANGGRVVHVFKTGKTFMTGALDKDPDELKGIKETLGIKSKLGVPLEAGGVRRGMVMLASLQPDYFTDDDARFAEPVARWIGTVVHRAELAEAIARNAAAEGRRVVAEELVTVLAHDLRNYLGPLGMRLHMLRHRATRDGRQEDLSDVERIDRTLARLTGLINDLLDVARIDRGIFQMEARAVDIAALLAEVAASFGTREQAVDVRVQSNVPLVVDGDPARLRQCLDNLVANAVQKSPPGAPVTVIVLNETRESGEWCRVDVIDQGPGIPEELLPRIFERYATGRAREGGLGLGLYLAQRIAMMHGGELKAESEPGKGARFCLALPCIVQ